MELIDFIMNSMALIDEHHDDHQNGPDIFFDINRGHRGIYYFRLFVFLSKVSADLERNTSNFEGKPFFRLPGRIWQSREEVSEAQ